jgi:imidazolonepropionase-like amidohydrolase
MNWSTLRRSAVVPVALVACISSGALHARSGTPSPARPLIIAAAALWTPQRLLPKRDVLVRNGRIEAVGESGSIARPPDARVITAHGDTLLPGLIDAHVHLAFFDLGDRLPPAIHAHPRASVFPVTGRQLLRAGVTAARVHLIDLENGVPFKRDADDDRFPAPRLQIGGPGFIGGSPTLSAGHVWGVWSVEDAIAKVRQVSDAGVDWVALHELTKFQPGDAEAIVGEARRRRLRVMAGGDPIADAQRAIELRVDSIEYLDRTPTARYPDSLIAGMQAQGAGFFIVPPIGFYHRFMEYRRGTMPIDDPLLTAFMQPGVAKIIADGVREDRAKETDLARTIETSFATLPDKFRQLRAAGLNIAIGTDCGSWANFHADAIWWELETWRRLGVAPGDIVRAATTTGAALLGRTDVGRLDVGARGDLMLYRGRIDSGPFAIDRVRTVAKGGVLYVDEGRWVGP